MLDRHPVGKTVESAVLRLHLKLFLLINRTDKAWLLAVRKVAHPAAVVAHTSVGDTFHLILSWLECHDSKKLSKESAKVVNYFTNFKKYPKKVLHFSNKVITLWVVLSLKK